MIEAPVRIANPVERVTKPRLSEAIRLGGLSHPQSFGEWQTATGAGCALGVAMHAVGVRVRLLNASDEEDMRSVTSATRALARRTDGGFGRGTRQCPVYKETGDGPECNSECDDGRMGNQNLIMHLNDVHRWSFNQIADHLESLGH